jgi:hypothetical protein
MPPDLAQHYWDVANAIVGFSVLQMLAFLYALAKREFRSQVVGVYRLVAAAIAVSSLLYIAGVVSCYCAEMKLRGEIGGDAGRLLLYTLFVRVGIIGLYSLFGISMLLAIKWRDVG